MSLRKSLLINFLQNYGIIALQFIASLILARLLSPSEIGIYSVAATLIALAQVVRDFGVGQYIIQEKELTPDRIKSAFSLSVISSVTLAIIAASLCNVAADFYREPGVHDVMLVLAVNFLLVPFGQITAAHLQREMRFLAIATVRVGSAVVHFVASISLAYLGYGYMSLAYASLAGAIATTVITNFYRPRDMSWKVGFKDLRRVLNFGSYSVLANLANALSKGVGDLVLGRMINMNAVGLFSRAGGLIEIFNQGVMGALWTVALPHFSKAVRDGTNIQSDFLKSSSLITGLAWPFFGVLALLANPMVLLLYGANWLDCAPLVKWICLAYFVIAPFYLFGSILVALGQVKKMMLIEAGTLPIQFGIYIFGAASGNLEIVAIANVIYSAIKATMVYFVLVHHLKFTFNQFITCLWRSLAVMVVTLSTLKLTLELFPLPVDSYWLSIVMGGTASTVGWLIGIFITKHPLSSELKTIAQRYFSSKIVS